MAMDIAQIVLEIAILVAFFFGSLWIKNYLPSYMKKKGENLATKEDVKDITRLTEEVRYEFTRRFEEYSKDT